MQFEYDLVLMSAVIFLPSLFALVLLLFPKGWEEWMRWWSLLGTAVTLVASLYIFIDYRADVVDAYSSAQDKMTKTSLNSRAEREAKASEAPPQRGHNWVARRPWIEPFGIDYYLGVDGISLALVLLTTVVSFLAMMASWPPDKKKDAEHDDHHEPHWAERHVRGYCMLFLILETGMIGTFLALDFFLFYIFWEVMLLPMYFLIGVWGGPRREYAAIKFFLYTLLGSVFILIALLGFYFTDVRDFDPRADGKEVRNSFDLIVLQEAGQGAAQILNDHRDNPISRGKADIERLTKEKEKLQAENAKDPKLAELRAAAAKAQEAAKAAKEDQARQAASVEARNDFLARRNELNGSVTKIDDQLTAVRGRTERLEKQWFFNAPWFQVTMFLLLFVGFAIKVPLFPFHTWLPDAHVEAPTPISMILAGVLLKMGGYGIIRIAYPICPYAAELLAWWVSLFGMINIVYGAFAAMAQTDFKKLVAYSSVSHMGYVILGIAVWSATDKSQYWSWGMNGAMFQMIAHGITSAGMFFLVGVIYDRAHHRNLDNFRGLYEPMPLYGGISAVIFFAAMGLPGMCGFVGEFMVVLATWNYSPLFAILAALTVVLTAAYILWTLQRVFLGTNPAYKDFPDMTLREILCIAPLVILSVALGVLPQQLLLSWMEPTVSGLVKLLAQVGAQ